ncbi:MAG: glycoside hydrolase family 2 protein [Phycisphaerae bacterium]
MHLLDLCGKWELRRKGERSIIAASVPGCVHTDLLEAGEIPDPFHRDDERRVQWVGRADWVYSRDFKVPEELLDHRRILLQCDGLDTLAGLKINGRRVGQADNMFRRWEFDVGKLLRAGENTIEITFASAQEYVEKRQRQRPLPYWGHDHKTGCAAWLRKEQCNFGWDWGPMLVTCGIWRPIKLLGFSKARLEDVHIRQKHTRGGVTLTVDVSADTVARIQASAETVVSFEGKELARRTVRLKAGRGQTKIRIGSPKLWWPNGMGEQPLYDVQVELKDHDSEPLDRASRRIGLRKLELDRRKDRWGESFRFRVNGRAFFAKGANWIPADVFQNRVTPRRYRQLLQSAADANMNFLRVWGGGIYEQDEFYDLCDELGLCVWQDFMFACSTYPTFDESFMDNVAAEADQNVRRLRHHPCVALWCGNNELEQGLVADKWTESSMSWDDYKPLFDKLLPNICRKLDPEQAYWPSSAHSPRGDRHRHSDPRWGDAHLWAVWHGRQPFEWYRGAFHRFCSEFGFQSFPQPRTTRKFTEKRDRNVTSPVMEHHQRSGIGNDAILQYMASWFRMPTNFDNLLWLSQILQLLGIQYAVEHWRRNMPRCMGAIYWQLNDCWPAASWSSIDCEGRWKALQYGAKRFFAPLLLSAEEDTERGRIDLHVTSDLAEPKSAQVHWTLVRPCGEILAADAEKVECKPAKDVRAARLDLRDPLSEYGPDDLLLFAALQSGGDVASTTCGTFAKPKRMELEDPQFKIQPGKQADGTFTVRLEARRPALWTWLELTGSDAQFSDNFFHLWPGVTHEVTVRPGGKLSAAQFRKKLRVRSLVDTY